MTTLLTQQQVSDMLNVSIPTLISWRKAGLLKAIKIGSLVRYDPDEIKRFLKDHRETNRQQRRAPF